MIIAQLTDLHIPERDLKTYGIAPMSENLIQTVEHINKFVPRPDVVLVTGDITANALYKEAEYAFEILNGLAMPFYIVPGNHDNTGTLLSVFRNTFPVDDSTTGCYIVDDYDVRLIGLDTTVPEAPGGQVSQSTAESIDCALADKPHKPTVLFMHHPPVRFSVLETDADGFDGAELLASVVQKYSNIERILCGHIHLPADVRWNGTVVSTAPSTGMELILDLTMKKPSGFVLTNPAYQLHCRTSHNNIVSHTVYVRGQEKKYVF